MGYRYRRSGSRYSANHSRYPVVIVLTRRRRTTRRRSARAAQRIVIQVIGGQGGVPASPITLGQKSRRVVRSRF